MTPWELLGMAGLIAGGTSASVGVLLAYAEARRWSRLRRARRRLVALCERDGRTVPPQLAALGDELGAVEFAWPEQEVRGV